MESPVSPLSSTTQSSGRSTRLSAIRNLGNSPVYESKKENSRLTRSNMRIGRAWQGQHDDFEPKGPFGAMRHLSVSALWAPGGGAVAIDSMRSRLKVRCVYPFPPLSSA